jgi:PKD repeat protein
MRRPARPPDRDCYDRQRPPHGGTCGGTTDESGREAAGESGREAAGESGREAAGESGRKTTDEGGWGPTLAWDDRAVSVAVSYVLALGITAILISGLLVASSDYLEDERQRATVQELDDLGNELAGAFADADRLSRSGGETSLTVERPTRIAGSDYTVEIRHGPICSTPSESDCLHLQSAADNVSITVPLANRSRVSLSPGDGHWQVGSSATGSPGDSTLGTDVEVQPNIGIGRGVDGSSDGDTVDPRNRDPIAGFTFSPGYPTLGEQVQFRNDTKDLDGRIVAYEWDVNDDGTVDGTSPRLNYTFTRPGKYDVRLMIEDNNGATANVTKTVSVSGLVYENDAVAADLDGDGTAGAINFTVRNEFDEVQDGLDDDEVTLLNALIDPEDGNVDQLYEPGGRYDEEIIVSGSRDGARDLSNGVETGVPPGGLIVELRDDGERFPQVAGGGGIGRFTLASFDEDMDGEAVDIVLRYRVNGTRYTSEFTLLPGTGIADPDAAFDYAPTTPGTDETVTLNASDSTASAGSITDYSWTLPNGTTLTGPTREQIDVTFDSPGAKNVTLTVTDSAGRTDSVTEQIIVTGGASNLRVNFQPESAPTPSGYVADTGEAYGVRDNGYSYGWDTDNFEVRDRGVAGDERYDTLNHMQLGGTHSWEAAVPDGTYRVRVVAGDPDFTDQVNSLRIENVVVDDPEGSGVGNNDNFDDYVVTTEVTDGQLTISPTGDAKNAKLAFVEIEQMSNDGTVAESGGRAVVEAEHYRRNVTAEFDDGDRRHRWGVRSGSDASNSGYAVAVPNVGENEGDTTDGARLDYVADFDQTGTYYVWVRARGPSGNDDSVHVGLDGSPETYGGLGLSPGGAGWDWTNEVGGNRVTVTVSSSGTHTLSLWMREDGTEVDKLLVTSNASYTPSDEGPPESPPAALGGSGPVFAPTDAPTATVASAEWTLPAGTSGSRTPPARTSQNTASPAGESPTVADTRGVISDA